MKKRRNRILLAVLSCALSVAAAQARVVDLAAGMHRIEAELAVDPRGRAIGLMHRKQMPPQRGMLFAFPEVAIHCMWMKNTFLPLSVAFMDEDGRILNIARMTPHSEQSHCAAGRARYALEMNQGWFEQRGIKAGDLIRGAAKVRARD